MLVSRLVDVHLLFGEKSEKSPIFDKVIQSRTHVSRNLNPLPITAAMKRMCVFTLKVG